jgi:hypothetical protein
MNRQYPQLDSRKPIRTRTIPYTGVRVMAKPMHGSHWLLSSRVRPANSEKTFEVFRNLEGLQ